MDIVKVQTTNPSATCLFYNKDHSAFYQGLPDKALYKVMKGDPKKFFYYKVKGTLIVLKNEAPWQDW